jgi:hypothetical protein
MASHARAVKLNRLVADVQLATPAEGGIFYRGAGEWGN